MIAHISEESEQGRQCRVTPPSSHSNTGVKQSRAGLVLGWVISEHVSRSQRVKLIPNAVGAKAWHGDDPGEDKHQLTSKWHWSSHKFASYTVHYLF